MDDEIQANLDAKTVKDFGNEWKHFNQNALPIKEANTIFFSYFKIFPLTLLNKNSVGLDIGCGSGRWAKLVAPKIKKLYCIDASDQALNVAKKNLENEQNVVFFNGTVENIPLEDNTIDFAYSLGVLHHIPDTAAGVSAAVKKLKPGAPLLVYLYYALDNKPGWFRALWKISDYMRMIISKFSFKVKLLIAKFIALTIYYPLARIAYVLSKLNFNVSNFPLSSYKERSFYSMRTDALDRFGTRLEKRFSQQEIKKMLENASLEKIEISKDPPYWCAIGYKIDRST